MNIFVRYFDHETIVTNIDEVVDFLTSLGEVKFDDDDVRHIDEYIQSSNQYPFRLKVSFSNYVLFLKTEASTLDEFKFLEKQRKEHKNSGMSVSAEKKKSIMDFLNERHDGWYDASITFKRVVPISGTNKFQYQDATFHAQLKAESGMHCYNRIVEHLRNRQDVDPRSQFPSAKSNNFVFDFLGENPTAPAD